MGSVTNIRYAPTHSMFSHPGWQDGTISEALILYMKKNVFLCRKRVARLHSPKLLGRETFKVAAISWNRFGLETFHYKYPLNCEQLQISIEVKMLNIPLQTLNPKNKTNYLFAAATLGLKVKECSKLD